MAVCIALLGPLVGTQFIARVNGQLNLEPVRIGGLWGLAIATLFVLGFALWSLTRPDNKS